MKQVDIQDIYALRSISSPAASPDGNRVAFVVQQPKPEGDGYSGHIHLCDLTTGCVKQLTGLGEERQLAWLDDTTILFPAMRDPALAKRVKEGEMWTAFYALDITGGEATEYMRIPMRVGSITPVGGDRFVLSAQYFTRHPGLGDPSPEVRAEALKAYKADRDYEVVDEIPFWINGAGFTDGKRNRLYLYDRAADTYTPITGEREMVTHMMVQGDRLVFVSELFEERLHQRSGVYLYNLADDTRETLVAEGTYRILFAGFAGDDVVMAGTDTKTYGATESPNFYRCDPDGPKLILENDTAVVSVITTDQRLGSFRPCHSDGGYLYFVSTRGFCSHPARIDREGNLDLFAEADGAFFDAVPVQGGLAAPGQRGMRPPELYLLKDARETRLTDFNEAYYAGHALSTPEHFTFLHDGVELDGWVMLPPGCDPNHKYPGILTVHGGPKSTYGSVFVHELQVLASHGYAVFYTNPRGSDGRGDAFADIRGKLGTVDYDDVMALTDEVLRRYPCIDPSRLGITGGSYGGFMTNWAIGQTDRFKAAVTDRSIATWATLYLTSDFGYGAKDLIGPDPWQDAEKLWWHSPLKYAPNFKTPTLIVHSDADQRCWLVEGLQMFTALREQGVPSRMWICHGETHELSRSGQPKHRVRRLEEYRSWFDRYLK